MPELNQDSAERKPKKIGCMILVIIIGVILILFIWANIFRNGPPLRISKETTYITEPLTPDGRGVDYFAALEQRIYPPEMKTDENGYRVLFREAGDFSHQTSEFVQLQQRYEKLGLDVVTDKPTLTYIESFAFFQKRYETHPEDFRDIVASEQNEQEQNIKRKPSFDIYTYWQSLQQSPQLHENGLMQKWREENSAALDLAAEQVKKPVFVTPYIKTGSSFTMIAMLLPDAQMARDLARGWMVRSRMSACEGNFDKAIDDILACYQLGRHMEKQATLVEGLVGLTCEGIAAAIPYDLSTETRASEEQLKRLRDGIAALSPQKGLLEKMESERYMCLDTMTSVMQGFGSPRDPLGNGNATVDKIIAFTGIDWNLIFKRVNNAYDETIAGTYSYTVPPLGPVQLLTMRNRSEAVADIFIGMYLPAMSAVNEAYRRLDCTMNLRRIVLAMHLYEREHGTLPPTFSVDENGKPLHSWRTLLLPYFGDDKLAELYAQIRLDEPWDSEHNRQFCKQNIDVYRCPSNKTMPNGDTSYSVITGDGLLFTNDGQKQTFAGHGRNMLMVIERKIDAVCWMQPDAEMSQSDAELGINGKRSAPVPMGSNHAGGCNVGLRDGGVTFLSETLGIEQLRKLIQGTIEKLP